MNSRHRDFQSRALVRGLEPDPWDWYRFRPRGSVRPVERSRTTPLPSMPFARLRFAFTSCQHWERGYFTAPPAHAGRRAEPPRPPRRLHLRDRVQGRRGTAQRGSRATMTLEEYRVRHALSKLDPDLQRAHAAYPWEVTLNDPGLFVVGIPSPRAKSPRRWLDPCVARLRAKVAALKTRVRTRIRFPFITHDNPSQAIPTVPGSSETRIAAPDMRICAFGGAGGWRAWRESNPRPTA